MYDVAIIGGGPGGYSSALYAHNFGLSVVLVEKAEVGGTCLHRGCIPAKSWIHTAEVFAEVAEAATFGVMTSPPQVDWSRALARKHAVVSQLHKGPSRAAQAAQGGDRCGRRATRRTRVGGCPRCLRRLAATRGAKVIIATGSVPRSIPGFDPTGSASSRPITLSIGRLVRSASR